MPRKAVFIVAVSLAFAAVAGTIALTKTVHLGQAAAKPRLPKSAIAKRQTQLDRFEASLRAELKRRPPAVPKLPPTPAVSPAPAVAPAAAPAPAAQRVVYRRPAPIVIHKHRPGGGEHEGADHGDGGGGGGDD
jgi:hypothetical protein